MSTTTNKLPAASRQLTSVVRFRMSSETKGTFKYEECDISGEPEAYAYQRIGTLYVKKNAFKGVSAPPKFLQMTIMMED